MYVTYMAIEHFVPLSVICDLGGIGHITDNDDHLYRHVSTICFLPSLVSFTFLQIFLKEKRDSICYEVLGLM